MISKREKFFQIAISIFTLESTYGHLKWKVTDLEKKSKVSRTLIYRYFGSNKSDIFINGLKIFLNEFYGFSEKPSVSFPESIRKARKLMEEHREAVIFYQKWRLIDSELKEIFISTEKKFQKKLKNIFPNLNSSELMTAHACIHGLVTSPFLSPQEAQRGFEELTSKGVFK